MGITMLTALEIFSNPYDLEISVVQEAGGGKYAFVINRGPGHNFKPLISSKPFGEKLEDALDAVRGNLEAIHKAATSELENERGVYRHLLNGLIDQSMVLDPDLINRIIGELRRHKVASTYRMRPVTA